MQCGPWQDLRLALALRAPALPAQGRVPGAGPVQGGLPGEGAAAGGVRGGPAFLQEGAALPAGPVQVVEEGESGPGRPWKGGEVVGRPRDAPQPEQPVADLVVAEGEDEGREEGVE